MILALVCFGACALLAQTVVPPVTVKVEIVNPQTAKKPVAARESVDLSNIVVWLTPLAPGAGAVSMPTSGHASPQIAQTLSRRLQEWTGERWMVALVPGSTAPTLREKASAKEAERLSGVAANPLVQKIMTRFPGAQIVEVRNPDAAPAPEAITAGDDEIAYSDAAIGEDDI